MEEEMCECGEAMNTYHAHHYDECRLCGEDGVVDERPHCRYCGEAHDRVHCIWEHRQMGLPGYTDEMVFAHLRRCAARWAPPANGQPFVPPMGWLGMMGRARSSEQEELEAQEKAAAELIEYVRRHYPEG